MFNLLLIDVAACVALIMVAAFVMVMRWHRRGRPVPKLIRKVRRSAAGDTEWRAPRRAAVVPGFSRERGQPGAQQDMRAEGASPGRPSAQAGQPQPAARSGDPARAGQPAQAVHRHRLGSSHTPCSTRTPGTSRMPPSPRRLGSRHRPGTPRTPGGTGGRSRPRGARRAARWPSPSPAATGQVRRQISSQTRRPGASG